MTDQPQHPNEASIEITPADIMNELIAQRDERRTSAHFTEAPYSGNVRARIAGYDWQLTIRASDSKTFLDKINGLMVWLNNNADRAVNVETPRTESHPNDLPVIGPETPTHNQAATVQTTSDLTFHAEKLTVTVSEGKKYIKAKGGQFTQYGVTVWPEVLKAAGIDADRLDPMKGEYTINMIATYSLNDKGKASKVLKLTPAA